jgi:hypothetical protein
LVRRGYRKVGDTAREDSLPVFSNTGGLQPMADRQHEISNAQYTGIDLLEFAERRARPGSIVFSSMRPTSRDRMS